MSRGDERWRIEPEALAARLAENVCVADCRFSLADHDAGRRAYAAGHVPGAFRLDMEHDLSGPKGPRGGRHPLPNPETFAETLRHAGVRGDSLVVAYDDNRLAGAARLWWLLRYFGHERVKVLDGGFAAWRDAGLPVETSYQALAPGDFTARPHPRMTVDYESLRARLGDERLVCVDAREPERYAGIDEPIDPVAGRIPGAVNYPWQHATDEQGRLRPAREHAARWASLAGDREQDRIGDREIVVYCGSGVTASVNLLSLAMAGIEDALLYPGSWSDWCSRPDSPKEP